jgi:hypothetical protein
MEEKEAGLANKSTTSYHREYVDDELMIVRGAEEVRYGHSGWRGIFESPYVFGATLLASMGGFSYGYGIPLPNINTSCPD